MLAFLALLIGGLAAEAFAAVLVGYGIARGRRAPIYGGLAIGAFAVLLQLPRLPAWWRDTPPPPFLYWAVAPIAAVVAGVPALIFAKSRGARWWPLALELAVAAAGVLAVRCDDARARAPSPALAASTAQLAMARYHACAIDGASEIACGGANESGAAGSSQDYVGRFVPVGVGSARAIAVGDAFSCAVTAAGVVCWGELDGISGRSDDIHRQSPPTLVAASNDVRELYARGDLLAWRAADPWITVRDWWGQAHRPLPIPSDTVQFVVGSDVYCYRTRAGRVGCRAIDGDAQDAAVWLPGDGFARIAPVRSSELCAERAGTIECYALRSPYAATAASAPPRLFFTMAGSHLATTDSVVCGARGATLACVALTSTMMDEARGSDGSALDGSALVFAVATPTVRPLFEAELPSDITELYMGPLAVCARLRIGAFSCALLLGDCDVAVARRSTCTPVLRATPLGNAVE